MALPVSAGGILLASDINALLPPTWTSITLLASWANRAGYAAAGYRKLHNGAILEIVLNLGGPGTQTSGTTIFTLPAGYRPINTVQLPLIGRIASTPQQVGALEIDTAGAAKIYDIGSSATLHTCASFPLDR